MKKYIGLFTFLMCALSIQAQDKIVLKNGTTLEVKVVESNEKNVVFTYPNEDVRNEKPKSSINYILYSSGRKEICQSVQIPTINGKDDWEKVIVTTEKDDVEGLEKQGSMTVNKAFGMLNSAPRGQKAYDAAIKEIKKKAAKKKIGIVLITSVQYGGIFNDAVTISAETYK